MYEGEETKGIIETFRNFFLPSQHQCFQILPAVSKENSKWNNITKSGYIGIFQKPWLPISFFLCFPKALSISPNRNKFWLYYLKSLPEKEKLGVGKIIYTGEIICKYLTCVTLAY